jgi:hypothetical protein
MPAFIGMISDEIEQYRAVRGLRLACAAPYVVQVVTLLQRVRPLPYGKTGNAWLNNPAPPQPAFVRSHL